MEKLYCVDDTMSDKNPGKIRLTVGKVYEKIRTTINGEFIVINDSGVEGKYKPDRFYTAEQHTKLLMGKKTQKSKKIIVNVLEAIFTNLFIKKPLS